ncbi:hypothetical protein M8C21_028302, partial [Ambrosia artemisiifolia]
MNTTSCHGHSLPSSADHREHGGPSTIIARLSADTYPFPSRPSFAAETMKEKGAIGSRLASIPEFKPFNQHQHEVNITVASLADSPFRPNPDLIEDQHGRDDYLRIAIPLYKATIKCDWKAAKAILDKKPELVRYSLTETGETALHIAASIKRSKHVEKFVKNLVNMMEKEDLEYQNENNNTALYLAAANGNIKTVRIMVEENQSLTTIPGGDGRIMFPLYAAALYGNYEVVKYLYEKSHDLGDNGWTSENRGWLLDKCVEGDMFDIALKIKEKYPELKSGVVLGVLARKPYAFSETKTSIITIKRSIAL